MGIMGWFFPGCPSEGLKTLLFKHAKALKERLVISMSYKHRLSRVFKHPARTRFDEVAVLSHPLPFQVRVGRRLRKLRKQRGWTQVQLADPSLYTAPLYRIYAHFIVDSQRMFPRPVLAPFAVPQNDSASEPLRLRNPCHFNYRILPNQTIFAQHDPVPLSTPHAVSIRGLEQDTVFCPGKYLNFAILSIVGSKSA